MVSTSPFFSPLNPDNPGRNALSLLAYNPAAGVISSPLLPYLGCVTEIRTARLPRPGLMLPAPMQHYRVCGRESSICPTFSHLGELEELTRDRFDFCSIIEMLV